VAAHNLVLAHTEEMRAYILTTNVDKACCKSILDAFGDKFFAARADLPHLKECYAFISPIKLVANYE
jgi:hypothetical protein